MKKTLILLACFLGTYLFGFSQNEYNHVTSYTFSIKDFPLHYVSSYNPGLTITAVDEHKRKKATHILSYSDNGRMIGYKTFNKKNKLVEHRITEYNEDGRVSKRSYYKKGKLKTYATYTYQNKKLTEVCSYNGKDVITRRNTWSFDKDEKIQASTKYKRKGQKVKRKWNYVYDEEGNKMQSQLSNGKGKVLYTWNFECHEEGVKQEKEKKKTQVCKWKSDKGEYLLKTTQNFDEKGRIRKYVYRYSKADTTLIDQSTYNKDDKLIFKAWYTPERRLKKYESYSTKTGEMTSKKEWDFEGDHYSRIRFYMKDQLNTEERFVRDSEGRIEKILYFNKKGENYRTITLSYSE